MELIPINESKLKIMLDEIDMKEYRLGAESDCAELETRRAIRDILDAAREQIGFNTEGAEIFVQLYTSKRGGCELFVTKGNSDSSDACRADKIACTPQSKGSQPQSLQKSKKKDGAKNTCCGALTIRTGGLPDTKNTCTLAFSFSRLADVCKVCHILQERGISINSRAFFDDAGSFYLLLYGTGLSAYTRLDSYSFIHEYGSGQSPDKTVTYLEEHGNVICNKNAIQILSNL